MKTVLIISYSWLHRDPRILRQIQALKNDYRIMTMGFSPSNIEGVLHYDFSYPKRTVLYKIEKLIRLVMGQFEYILQNDPYHKKLLSVQIDEPNVIIANDWNGFYFACKLIQMRSWKSKIYYDAHEYATKQRKSLFWKLTTRPLITYTLRTYKPYISKMTTVCEGIAREYEKYFDFPTNSIDIITNAPLWEKELKPQLVGNKIKLIHHGAAIKERKLEKMIDMMAYLDASMYELTFMIVPTEKKYYRKIVQRAKKYKNIHFVEPVPFDEINSTLNKYDIGVFLVPETNFNYKHALPNKLFEFIQARLMVCIGPSVEMVRIVEKYGVGVSSPDFKPKTLAKLISSLSFENVMRYKNTCDAVAMELGAEKNIVKIQEIIRELV